ncbi:MAG: beta-ketoacyl-ACP synthase II [Spirochaetales bacterium]|nr:beta-ketoacyl-ACP synthase II [Spirochaetales bacterium]
MRNPDEIVITGIGTLTPIGLDRETFWTNLCAGTSGAAPITAFDTEGFTTTIACELKDFKAGDFMDRKNARKMSRFSQIAVCSALEAVRDAGLEGSLDPLRTGCVMGSAAGDYEILEKQFAILQERGPSKGHPLAVPRIIPNMAAGNIAIELGIHGPNMAALSACATGVHSIASAMNIIRCGQADVMIAGGTESTITPLVVDAYSCMRVLSTRNDEPQKASRPFDADRDGFVIGEGAASLILEKRSHAEARGARIYAVAAGVGMTADASSIAAPDEEGRWAALAMKQALAEARLPPEEIGYINAHGTSTKANDRTETRAILSVFGSSEDCKKTPPVSSNKSMIGHTLGAAGAVEAAATALSLYHGTLPPTINQDTPDPDCPLDTIPGTAREADIKAALTNSFGFGGQNAVLALTKEG